MRNGGEGYQDRPSCWFRMPRPPMPRWGWIHSCKYRGRSSPGSSERIFAGADVLGDPAGVEGQLREGCMLRPVVALLVEYGDLRERVLPERLEPAGNQHHLRSTRMSMLRLSEFSECSAAPTWLRTRPSRCSQSPTAQNPWGELEEGEYSESGTSGKFRASARRLSTTFVRGTVMAEAIVATAGGARAIEHRSSRLSPLGRRHGKPVPRFGRHHGRIPRERRAADFPFVATCS